MNILLSDIEARVLGCLLEKDMSTPDYYPLSLNAVVNACNQKSNRDPVMSQDESTVQAALDSMVKKHLVSPKSSSGSRVQKYAHRLSNPVTKTLDFSVGERAVICELLVRGPQTAGELRTHAGRLTELTDLGQVEAILQQLRESSEGPFVAELPRQPGRREIRYAHLFCGEVISPPAVEVVARIETDVITEDRMSALEREVSALRAELEQMKQQLLELAVNSAHQE